jgi:hypothetical protein
MSPHLVYGTYRPKILNNAEGGTLGLSNQTTGGTLQRIDFEPLLGREQLHTFSFPERVPDERHEPPKDENFSGQSFESPTLRYRVEVYFLGEQPKVVWGYDKLSRIECPGKPENGLPVELQLADRPDCTSSCTAEFADLYGGLCDDGPGGKSTAEHGDQALGTIGDRRPFLGWEGSMWP